MKANINVIEKPVPFEFMGVTYPLKMTWNVEAEIAERFGDIGQAFDGGKSMKNMLEVLAMLINESVDIHNEISPKDMWTHLDARYIGRHLDHNDAERIAGAVTQTILNSHPESAEEELTDDEKNGAPSR